MNIDRKDYPPREIVIAFRENSTNIAKTLKRIGGWRSIEKIEPLYPDSKRPLLQRMFLAEVREGSNLMRARSNLRHLESLAYAVFHRDRNTVEYQFQPD